MGRKDKPSQSGRISPICLAMRLARQNKQISLSSMATLLSYSKGYLSWVENGRVQPSLAVLQAYEKALELESGALSLLIRREETKEGQISAEAPQESLLFAWMYCNGEWSRVADPLLLDATGKMVQPVDPSSLTTLGYVLQWQWGDLESPKDVAVVVFKQIDEQSQYPTYRVFVGTPAFFEIIYTSDFPDLLKLLSTLIPLVHHTDDP